MTQQEQELSRLRSLTQGTLDPVSIREELNYIQFLAATLAFLIGGFTSWVILH